MIRNLNKKKEINLLLLKKEGYNTSFNELNKISLNFHLNAFHKKNNSKNGRLYSNYNNISKMSNLQNKYIDTSYINTYVNSPTTNFKSSNIDVSNSNNDLTNKIKSRDNISIKEYEKDLLSKKNFHHKKINSHLSIKNNQILNELFSSNITSNSNKAKDSLFHNKEKNLSKIIRKKYIQIDTNNINNNNNINMNNTTNKNTLSNNNNNQHKINLKIYLEKHQRVLSTDDNNNKDNNIKKNSKNKKSENKKNMNSVIKNKRLITKKNSTQLLKNKNKNNTLSRANSSWINKEYNIFNTSLEHSISKNIVNKINNKVKINNVIIKNINKNIIKEKQIDHIGLRNNDLLYLNKLKERANLYYLTNLNEDFKTKKKKYKGNNIFISINNYANDNKKKDNKDNVNLTEGKEINIENYITKTNISNKDNSKNRNYLKKNENKFKILGESENSSQNKSEENINSYNNNDNDNENDDNIQGPELTHFYLVTSIQKGKKMFTNYN